MSSSSYQQVGCELLQRLWSERVYKTMANDNTSGLWGRLPTRVALTDNTIFVLSDGGLFALGGTSSWHQGIGSVAQQATAYLPKTTPRSSALLMMNDARMDSDMATGERRHRDRQGNADGTKMANICSVLRYYSHWRPEFDGTKDTSLIENHFLSSVPHDRLFRSLKLRGKPCENSGYSKIDLASMLARDIILERDVLGEPGHKKLAVLDADIADLTGRDKLKTAKSLSLQFAQFWAPLAKEQAKRAKDEELESHGRKERERAARESSHKGWVEHRNDMRSKPITHGQGLLAGSVTSRGREIETPRNVEQMKAISGGSNHCALLLSDSYSSASLYTWGVGSLGRLGHETSRDLNYPTLVDQLKGVQIADVSGGQSHCAAASSTGDLYMWGTGTRGQLGFGQLGDEEEEFFCPIPTKLVFPTRVMRVSCGNGHTACIGQEGRLYVWGDSGGGRLGLGDDIGNVQYSPVYVGSLANERVVDVSCGCYQTLVLTATTSVGENTRISVRRNAGGRVYVAGPKHILGENCPTFRQLEVFEKSSIAVEYISAGTLHQALVTTAGEVYSWGCNRNGCCGQPSEKRFVETPTKIKWLYEAPSNLALGKPSRLSSRYKDASGLSANNAVDGDIDGHSEGMRLAHSQWEANAWFDVDLQSFAYISHIRLWNRTDEPDDCALPLDFFSKRLFPCYIMVSQFPFPTELSGQECLDAGLAQSVAKIRLTQNRKMSNWNVPRFTRGRHVRVQLDGTSSLHFAQLQVFAFKNPFYTSPISFVKAGKSVTVATILGTDDKASLETAFERAVVADLSNADILRQFRCYEEVNAAFPLETRKSTSCMLCVGDDMCEICRLRFTYKRELCGTVNREGYGRLCDLEDSLLKTSSLESCLSEEEQSAEVETHKTGGRLSALTSALKVKERLSKTRKRLSLQTRNSSASS